MKIVNQLVKCCRMEIKMYQLETWDFISDRWVISPVKNYRYADTRKEWGLRAVNAKQAQMPFRQRIVNTETGTVYDDWHNKVGYV